MQDGTAVVELHQQRSSDPHRAGTTSPTSDPATSTTRETMSATMCLHDVEDGLDDIVHVSVRQALGAAAG